MSLGFIIGSLFIRPLLRRLGWPNMIRTGAVVSALALAGLPFSPIWWIHAALLMIVGIGFFMIHNSLQGRVMEVAPEARGSATALHYFSFFVGQAAGPFLFGLSLVVFGAGASFAICAIAFTATGLVASPLLRLLLRPRA